jgi:acetolactate synthase-1/2/3 large subunit
MLPNAARDSGAPAARKSMVVPKGPAEPSNEASPACTISEALVNALAALGVEHAFGLFGGAIAPFCEALSRSPISIMHARHEGGAAFAAIEASLATGKLVVVFATTGPGLTNLYTGMVAARGEGAKVLFVSGCTSAAQRGRGAFQETGGASSAMTPLFTNGAVFHHSALVEDPAELDAFVARLASGVHRPGGFVAHIGLPIALQTARRAPLARARLSSTPPPVCDADTVARCVELLSNAPFVIWTGFGSREASLAIRALAEVSGARVMATPRAKGVFPENHPQYLGVTGLGGHGAVEDYLRKAQPARVLVLGSRLGEMVSFWSPDLVPREGLVHVDLDPDVFGAAYPDVPTLGVQAEIGAFVEALVAAWPRSAPLSVPPKLSPSELPPEPRDEGAVRPSFLMKAIQRNVVEGSDAIVLTEAGNAFALGSHYLRFTRPGRYRVSTGFGSMGQAAAGVIGSALGRSRKAVGIVGDGAMLMHNEVNTAVNYGLSAVWIVLNDARYGMIEQGMQSIGWKPFETDFPRSDFVSIARAMGGDGVRVERERDVEEALQAGLSSLGPFVIDVIIDPHETAPSVRRNQSLRAQGLSSAPKRAGEPQ